MVRHPLAIVAINPPDGDRRTPHVWGHVARHALIRRGDVPLLAIGHQAVGILPATPLHPLVDRVGLERLAPHRQQVPWPWATQDIRGHVLQRLPARSRRLRAPTGGEQRPRGRRRPMAPMRLANRAGASSQRLAPDGAGAIISALPPAAHARAPHARRGRREGRTAHGWHRQDDGPRDDPLVEDLAHLAAPVIARHFGPPQAQGRLTTPRHPMCPLTAVQAAVCDIAHQVGVPTRPPLGSQAVVRRRLLPRLGVLQRLPVRSQDRLEDLPVPCRCHKPQGAPR
jgi:hypothetical protein